LNFELFTLTKGCAEIKITGSEVIVRNFTLKKGLEK
jgi:hypothetical protein